MVRTLIYQDLLDWIGVLDGCRESPLKITKFPQILNQNFLKIKIMLIYPNTRYLTFKNYFQSKLLLK
jgi:hypothetical protein